MEGKEGEGRGEGDGEGGGEGEFAANCALWTS